MPTVKGKGKTMPKKIASAAGKTATAAKKASADKGTKKAMPFAKKGK